MKIIVVEDQNENNFESLGTTVQMFKGTDNSKVRMLRGWGYLENVRRHAKGEGSKIDEIERTCF